MAGEIEKRPEAALQRDLERGPVNVPARLAGVGSVLAAAGVGLIAVGGGLPATVLAPFYFMAVFGSALILGGGASWIRRRRRARQEPPVPPARLLPP